MLKLTMEAFGDACSDNNVRATNIDPSQTVQTGGPTQSGPMS